MQQFDRIQIDATPTYAIALCGAPEFRTLLLQRLIAPELPSGSHTQVQINATPNYGRYSGFPGRIGYDDYGILKLINYLLGDCAIASSTVLEIVASIAYVSIEVTTAGTTTLVIVGSPVLQGAAIMTGCTVVAITGTWVACGVVQMDGSTSLIIVVTANGVFISCFTGDGWPVLPSVADWRRKNYVF
jgi:hypothetical protein